MISKIIKIILFLFSGASQILYICWSHERDAGRGSGRCEQSRRLHSRKVRKQQKQKRQRGRGRKRKEVLQSKFVLFLLRAFQTYNLQYKIVIFELCDLIYVPSFSVFHTEPTVSIGLNNVLRMVTSIL